MLKYMMVAMPFELTISASLRLREMTIELYDVSRIKAVEKAIKIKDYKESEDDLIIKTIEEIRFELLD